GQVRIEQSTSFCLELEALWHAGTMWYAAIEFDILLGAVGSRKAKRSAVRPIIAEIRRRFEVSVAEVGHLDLHRRALIGVVVTAADSARVIQVLDDVERHVAWLPEIDLLNTRRHVHHIDDYEPGKTRPGPSARPGHLGILHGSRASPSPSCCPPPSRGGAISGPPAARLLPRRSRRRPERLFENVLLFAFVLPSLGARAHTGSVSPATPATPGC